MKPEQKKLPFDPIAYLSNGNRGQIVSNYRTNQAVYRQDDPADSVFYILTGKAKVAVVSEEGKEAVVAVLGAGDFFGEGCLIGQALRLATVVALTESAIMQITKPEITSVIHKESAFAEFFIAHLLARNSHIEEDLADQLFNSSEKRLARALLLLANCGEKGEPELVLAQIRQGTLAEIIGTTRARVSFFMNKFRRLGLIDYNGRQIEVHSSLLNRILHESTEVGQSETTRDIKGKLNDKLVSVLLAVSVQKFLDGSIDAVTAPFAQRAELLMSVMFA